MGGADSTLVYPDDLAPLVRDYAARCHADPQVAQEHVQVTVSRLRGFQNRAEAGSGHRVLIDEPVLFGGRGEAADPAELLLAAVGASLSVTLTAHAALLDIELGDISIDLRATMDARSFLDPDAGQGVGLLRCEVMVTLRSPMDETRVRGLFDTAVRASPVLGALKVSPILKLRIEGAQ